MLKLLILSILAVSIFPGCGDDNNNPAGSGGTAGAGGFGGVAGTGGSGGGDGGLLWPCTEQGILDAITFGGGPQTFACDGPTVVTTSGTIVIDNGVILDGEDNLTVDGDRSHGVFRVGHLVSAELRNLTITRGYAVFAGAAIYSQGDLILDGCNVVENESDDIAAGIYSYEGALEVVNSSISRNEASRGAVMWVGGDVSIRDSTISQNIGGGIRCNGTTNVRDSIINGNKAEFGGGGIVNTGDLVVSKCTISSNQALRGGGIINVGRLWIYSTTVDGNIAEEGGGIYGSDADRFDEGDLVLSSLGLVDVQYSTISNNTADRGAGIYSISLRMTAWNSTFSGNAASEGGGALYIGGTTLGASTTYLTTTTLANNSAPLGSGVYGAGETPTVRFSGNIIDGDCHASDEAVTWESQGSNIESPGDSCAFGEDSDMVNVTSQALSLGPLANNGGDTETDTHLPMAGSVAIDAIPVEQCGDVLPVFPLLDQRVIVRPQGAGCDVGSVEVVQGP
jgi:hypothetical protein